LLWCGLLLLQRLGVVELLQCEEAQTPAAAAAEDVV
jgi:hypothetical protein